MPGAPHRLSSFAPEIPGYDEDPLGARLLTLLYSRILPGDDAAAWQRRKELESFFGSLTSAEAAELTRRLQIGNGVDEPRGDLERDFQRRLASATRRSLRETLASRLQGEPAAGVAERPARLEAEPERRAGHSEHLTGPTHRLAGPAHRLSDPAPAGQTPPSVRPPARAPTATEGDPDLPGEVSLQPVVTTQPDGMVRVPSAEVYARPSTASANPATLSYMTAVPRITTKQQVDTTWWYEIEYSIGGKPAKGWTQAEGIAELAWPGRFEFLSPGAGFRNPFSKLRKAVSGTPVEGKVARCINYLNVVLLPSRDATLNDFVREAFFHALVAANGNFKEASLTLTASIRAFKPDDGGGRFRWVQQVDAKSKKFSYAQYADKLWHFFWSAYLRFDGTSAKSIDRLGVAYELKSRSSPVWSAVTFKGLSRDAKEDIAFNRGGIAFAEWINKNHSDVTNAYAAAMRDELVGAAENVPRFRSLPRAAKAKLIQDVMTKEAMLRELERLTYREFSRAAAGIFDNVVKATAKIE